MSGYVAQHDLREEDDRFLLHVDVPGVDPKDIDIAVEDGVLSLSGQRESTAGDQKEGLRRAERVAGKFFRRFTLPDGIDPEAVLARSENGVLEISIPKATQAQRKRVLVDVN